MKTTHAIERPIWSDASKIPPAKRTKVQSWFFLTQLMGGRARVWLMLCSLQWIAYLSTRFLPAVSSGTQSKCSRNTTNVAHTSHTTIHAKVKEFWEVAKEETVVDLKKLGVGSLTFDKWTGEQEIPEVLLHSEHALFKHRLYNSRDPVAKSFQLHSYLILYLESACDQGTVKPLILKKHSLYL